HARLWHAQGQRGVEVPRVEEEQGVHGAAMVPHLWVTRPASTRTTSHFRRDDPGRMLEVLGEEEEDLTAIDRLNELLEAERAGVDTLSRLFPEALSPEMQKLFEEVKNDEAWSCAGLVRSIKAMGGTISEKKGDFAEKVMSEPTLTARLRFLYPGLA